MNRISTFGPRILSLACLLLLASCAGPATVGPDNAANPAGKPGIPVEPAVQPEPSDPAPFSFPAIDELSGPWRDASFTLVDGHADGSGFNSLLPNNRLSAAGSSGVFAPAFPPEGAEGDKVAYGIWSFQLPAYFGTPVQADFSWSDAPGAGLTYIGLANWATGRWNWKQMKADNSTSYGAFTNYINGGDTCLLAVVVLGSSAAILDGIQISTPQPPVASIVPDTDSGIAPLSVSFDGSGSTDADGTIANYEWDLDGDGLFNETGFEQSAEGSDSTGFDYGIPGTFNATLRVTDNDGNQDEASVEINVAASQPPVADLQADFTTGDKPLMVTFNATASSDPDGSVTDYEWDFDGDGTYGEAGDEATAQGDPTPLAYAYTEVGSFEAKVRVTDNDGGKDSASLTITVNNTPPTAVLDADLVEGNAPFDVTFSAAMSTDPGGTIDDYEWDFDGDGVYNEPATPEESARGNPSPDPYNYADPGPFNASIRVTDDDNAQDVATLNITSHGWIFVIVHDPAEGNVSQTQTALVGGNPAMAYRAGNSTLKYSRSTTPLGLKPEDWMTVTIPNPSLGNPGRDLCFADVNGSPAIAYTESPGSEDLYYHVASGVGDDADLWTDPLNLDSTGTSTGYNPEIIVANGNPAIAYDRDNDLYYTRATNTTGNTAGVWSAPVNIQGAALGSANGCSLGIVQGNPAVGYYRYDGMTYWFEYARSSTAEGTAAANWSTKVTITTSYAPNKPQIFIANGNPAFVFMDSDTSTWRYVRATNATGGAWGSTIDVGDGSTNYLTSVSGASIGGFPMACGWNMSGFDLMFAQSATASGTADADWSAPVTIDGQTNNNGASCELIEVQGRPAIGYIEVTLNAAKYAIRY